MTTVTATDAAREAARETTGQFGTQGHAESGLVEVSGREWEVSRMMNAYRDHFSMDASFEIAPGPDFRIDVRGATLAMNKVYDDADFQVEFRTDSEGAPTTALMTYTDKASGLTAIGFVDEAKLTLDPDAWGEDGARATFAALLAHREYLKNGYVAALAHLAQSAN